MLRTFFPFSVRCFVLKHKQKRFSTILIFRQPFQRLVCNNIRNIAFCNRSVCSRNYIRIVIVPLARKDFPMIKACGYRFQVPFAYQCSFVAIFSEKFREGDLTTIKSICICSMPIYMTMCSREH